MELLSHERAELRVVHPALRGHAQTRAFAEEHDLQVSQLEQTVYELDGLDAIAKDEAERLDHEFQAQKALAMDEVALDRGGGPGVHLH